MEEEKRESETARARGKGGKLEGEAEGEMEKGSTHNCWDGSMPGSNENTLQQNSEAT